MEGWIDKHLLPIDTMWQPADYLPDARDPDFINRVRHIQNVARDIPYDVLAVLIGDMITEEALPTYQSELLTLDGIDPRNEKGWAQWSRRWSGEENGHGDTLHTALYLTGRVDMRSVQRDTQQLIGAGIKNNSAGDPLETLFYVCAQERATHTSHSNVGKLLKKAGNTELYDICSRIGKDETRHATAYEKMVQEVINIIPSEMVVLFSNMMKKDGIIMPAALLTESGKPQGELFNHFSHAAQRTEVYTAQDYLDIYIRLITKLKITDLVDLTPEAQEAQEYLCGRLPKVIQMKIKRDDPSKFVDDYKFSWISEPESTKTYSIPNEIR